MFLWSQNVLLTVISIVLIFSDTSQSLRFDVDSSRTKCISEDINNNSMTVGKYSVVNPHEGQTMPPSHKITVEVASHSRHIHHHADQVVSGQFAFTAVESGDHYTCFTVVHHQPPLTLSVEFDWTTGVQSRTWDGIAKKRQVEGMEFEVKSLIEKVNSIHDEMFDLREREEEMQDLNRSTNTKMALFSFFSLIVCMGVAGMQFFHLKTFFEKKKVI